MDLADQTQTASAAPPSALGLRALADLIMQRRRRVSRGRALLVALSGIDGSGKGHC